MCTEKALFAFTFVGQSVVLLCAYRFLSLQSCEWTDSSQSQWTVFSIITTRLRWHEAKTIDTRQRRVFICKYIYVKRIEISISNSERSVSVPLCWLLLWVFDCMAYMFRYVWPRKETRVVMWLEFGRQSSPHSQLFSISLDCVPTRSCHIEYVCAYHMQYAKHEIHLMENSMHCTSLLLTLCDHVTKTTTIFPMQHVCKCDTWNHFDIISSLGVCACFMYGILYVCAHLCNDLLLHTATDRRQTGWIWF